MSDRHRDKVWALAQDVAHQVGESQGWVEQGSSRYFERVLQHPCGIRFESSPLDATKNPGLSLLTLTGTYFWQAGTREQLSALENIYMFPGRFHFTRMDTQLTSLAPEQTAEMIVSDVQERKLWCKGYRTFEPHGVKNIHGQATEGLSAYFGSPKSDRRAISYNKGAESGWKTPARRDEVHLRAAWAEKHTVQLIEAIAGQTTENGANQAYQEGCAAIIDQHMQYIDLNGLPMDLPKNWARGRRKPKWWKDSMDVEYTPVRLTRKAPQEAPVRFEHCKKQWSRVIAEYMVYRVNEGLSDTIIQSMFDTSAQFLQHLKQEDVERMAEGLPEEEAVALIERAMAVAEGAAYHSEHVL